ncbi:uncharacterized protein N7459_001247 [Penicillium hispanicum]|uniref:uncharacterized protein n=1 Tax=Penicillium hispanicum TaxID=1080232 RepID=UPI0025412736|nr:uncharacterized protein N7459_001247 [Penicillium hispanicum]KAJ5595039.1 hypothetical protein N7459_001247 [Penicillium hispanicum]
MSFGRHAYRHALKPPAAPAIDHLWISEDLLAATFRRFAHGQRRHGSCVPGPLEARRRLAKRRNTVLASIGGGPAEDIACLFGRNGREHMKWTDHPWQRAPPEAQGASEVHLPFYDHNPDPIETHRFDEQPATSSERCQPSSDDLFREFLERKDWKIEDARDVARRLKIDLQREPRYSRQIFDALLTHPADLAQAIRFLDDPFLNTRGSGNYLAAVEFVQRKTKRSNRTAVLNAVTRALELGLVPTDELCLIVKAVPNIVVERNKTLAVWDRRTLLKHYRAMWKAIGRCNILGYHDLDKNVVDTWLKEILSIGCFRFAEEVIVATHDINSDTQWPSTLILAWLEATSGLSTGLSTTPLPYLDTLLNKLEPDYAARCIVNVTELLALSQRENHDRNQLLEHWRDFLLQVSNISAIANSSIWFDMPLACNEPSETGQPIVSRGISSRRQIVLRIWALRALCRSQGPMYNQSPRETDKPIYLLLNLYQTTTQSTDSSFLAELMHGIHSLDLPYSSLLMLAVDLKLRKLTTKTTRRTLERLETSQTSLADIWTKPSLYRGVRGLFYGTFEQMFRSLDLTSSEYVQECLRLARVGDSQSVWSILTLLRHHTPLKLCLNKAWVPIPHPDEKALVRYHPGPRDSQCPDPHLAVDFIHQLAVAFSCCPQLTPSRSFHLIHWLYDYLRRHGGPVYPSLVRAMYHAGVVRYRREGRRLAATQYEYIMWIIMKFEGPEVVKQLATAPQIGHSMSGNNHAF